MSNGNSYNEEESSRESPIHTPRVRGDDECIYASKLPSEWREGA